MANASILKNLDQKRNRICAICGKTISIGYNRPHSLHKTKKFIKPNLQKINGQLVCTRCLRSTSKK